MRFSKSHLAISLTMFAALGLGACAKKAGPLQLTIPDSLRARCSHPGEPEKVKTVSDLAAFSIRQDAAIDICDAARSAVVILADAHNAAIAPKKKPWWRIR